MKKTLSLLLAGLMALSMAVSAMAITVTPGNQVALETIYGINGSIYYPIVGLDPVDPGFSVTPNPDALYWFGNATCPVNNCNQKCEVYLLPAETTSLPYAYCKFHGFNLVDFKNVTIPGDTADKTYKITTTSFAGGSILLDGNACMGEKIVNRGATVNVSVVPEYGYITEAVYVNGYYVGDKEVFQLTNIYRDYSIRAIFRKVNVNKPYTITASAEGEGGVYAVVNGKSIGAISSLTGTYADKVTLRFTPVNSNYYVENVVINGVSKGKISTYEVGRMLADMTVKVTFAWNCPFTDVAKEHLAAVEYVSEIDVMGSPNKHIDTDKFMGKNSVTVRAMACYLAELADVDDKLESVAQRIQWAVDNGLLDAKEDQYVKTTWTRACDMLNAFVRLLEKNGNLTFKALEKADTAYAVASAMKLVTEAAYKANGAITRYDMAEICYAVSQLEVK
ncbi:MAG: hypothetical protein IKY52_13160 [Clostridia bacterium]|nr:hypothetical protein [Clostridia bacterium]